MAKKKNPMLVAQQAGAAVNRTRNSQLLASYAANPASISGAAKGLPHAPQAPPAQSPPGQPQAPGGQFTPDAEYMAGAAQRAFDRKTALENLTTQGENDKGDTQEAIRRLLAGAPEQRQGIKQGANRAGLFYSGQLGKQLDSYEADLTRQQGDINLDFQRREDARIAARQAIENGMPLEEAAALAEAAGRQVQRDSDAADVGSLAATPSPAAPVVQAASGRRAALRRVQRARRRR